MAGGPAARGAGGGAAGGDAGGNGGFGGQAGLARMFDSAFGGQISWLLPAALILLVAGLWFTRRAPRTDRIRAALLLVGRLDCWSPRWCSRFMEGTFHAVLHRGAGARPSPRWWRCRGRERGGARDLDAAAGVLAGTTAVTAVWAWVLLGRSTTFLPWLRWVVLAVGVVAAIGLLVPAGWRARAGHGRRAARR